MPVPVHCCRAVIRLLFVVAVVLRTWRLLGRHRRRLWAGLSPHVIHGFCARNLTSGVIKAAAFGSLVVDGASGDCNEVKFLIRGEVPRQGLFLPHFVEKCPDEAMHLGGGFCSRYDSPVPVTMVTLLSLVRTLRTDMATSHVRPDFVLVALVASNKGGRRRASILVALARRRRGAKVPLAVPWCAGWAVGAGCWGRALFGGAGAAF